MFVLVWLARVPAPKISRVLRLICGKNAGRNELSRLRSLVIPILGSCLLFQPAANAQLKPVRRVVIFYELGVSSPAVALMDREIRATFDASRYQVELYAEYLETTLFNDPTDQQRIRES